MTRPHGPVSSPRPAAIREDEWQDTVVQAAQLLGWRVAHFRTARTKDGWRTPVAADGKGFPDLVLVGHGRLIVAELKSNTGRVTAEQQAWLDALTAAGIETHVWRPRDWHHVLETLDPHAR